MNKKEKRQLREVQQAQIEREQRAENKAARKAQKLVLANQRALELTAPVNNFGPVDVACLIHGNGYEWTYVERLFNMVVRNLSRPVKFHVYTEHDRSVPPHMIKHILTDWPGISGPRKSWWYKMQLFRSDLFEGQLLYFDLDTVIVNRLDWITSLHPQFFWAPKDFRSLWRANHTGINSSVMWWDTRAFDYIWQDFSRQDLNYVIRAYHGDQDFISASLDHRLLRYFEPMAAQSWRWQAKDGGMNFKSRMYLAPNTGTKIDFRTSILIFHGNPKPHEIQDSVIVNFWK